VAKFLNIDSLGGNSFFWMFFEKKLNFQNPAIYPSLCIGPSLKLDFFLLIIACSCHPTTLNDLGEIRSCDLLEVALWKTILCIILHLSLVRWTVNCQSVISNFCNAPNGSENRNSCDGFSNFIKILFSRKEMCLDLKIKCRDWKQKTLERMSRFYN